MAAVAVLSAAAVAASLLCARPRPTRHQLVSRMAPNTKGSGFEWKDPTSIYLHGEAFAATVDVLASGLRTRYERAPCLGPGAELAAAGLTAGQQALTRL